MGSLSIGHWGLLLVAAFLLLGRSKFSAAMGGLGQGLKNFREGLTESSSAMGLGRSGDEANPAAEPPSPDISETSTEVSEPKRQHLRRPSHMDPDVEHVIEQCPS